MNPRIVGDLGGWLRHLRQTKAKTLREIAASAGLDSAVLSKIERGSRLPTETQATSLARTFGIPEVDLQSKRIAVDFVARYGRGAAARKALDAIQAVIEKHKADDAVTKTARRRRSTVHPRVNETN